MESQQRCWTTATKFCSPSPNQTASSETMDDFKYHRRLNHDKENISIFNRMDDNSTYHESDHWYTDSKTQGRNSDIGAYSRLHSKERLRAMVESSCMSNQKPKVNELGEKVFTINRVNHTMTKSAKKLHIKRKKRPNTRSSKFVTPVRRPQSAKKPR